MSTLKEENERLREALKFYADERNYEPTQMRVLDVDHETKTVTVGSVGPVLEWQGAVDRDQGSRARKALGVL